MKLNNAFMFDLRTFSKIGIVYLFNDKIDYII